MGFRLNIPVSIFSSVFFFKGACDLRMQNIPDLSQAGLLQVSAKMASLNVMFLQLTFIFSEICSHYLIIFVFHLTVDEELWS